MSHYQTEQKRVLFQYLEKNKEHSYSIDELVEGMKTDPDITNIPGKSTVYRLISELVQEGLVKRFVKGNSRQFIYQLVHGEHCGHHLHMKCSLCGKLIHMEDEESEAILAQVLEKHKFFVDEGNTILFGQCDTCKHRA